MKILRITGGEEGFFSPPPLRENVRRQAPHTHRETYQVITLPNTNGRDEGYRELALSEERHNDLVPTLFRMTALLCRLRPDILHTSPSPVLQLAAMLAGVRHVLVTQSRSTLLKESSRGMHLYNALTEMSTVSEERERRALILRGVPAERIAVIPHGVSPLSPLSTKERAALCHRLKAEEELPFLTALLPSGDTASGVCLLRAAARLFADTSRFTLLLFFDGDGSSLLRFASLFGMRERVRVLPRADAESLLGLTGIFTALPSSDSTDAAKRCMSLGIPAVALGEAGKELLWHGRGGILCPTDDPCALAAAWRTLLESPALRRRHALFAAARYRTRYSRESMETAYVALYRKMTR